MYVQFIFLRILNTHFSTTSTLYQMYIKLGIQNWRIVLIWDILTCTYKRKNTIITIQGAFASYEISKTENVFFFLIIKEFCEGSGDKSSIPPTLLLILSRLCLDFEGSTISYLVINSFLNC